MRAAKIDLKHCEGMVQRLQLRLEDGTCQLLPPCIACLQLCASAGILQLLFSCMLQCIQLQPLLPSCVTQLQCLHTGWSTLLFPEQMVTYNL